MTAKFRGHVLLRVSLPRDSHFFHVLQKLLPISHAFRVFVEDTFLLFWWHCKVLVMKCAKDLPLHRDKLLFTVWITDHSTQLAKGFSIHPPGLPGH